MSNTVSFKCLIENTDPACNLGLKISFNQTVLYDSVISNNVEFACNIPDNEGEHALVFEMHGKTTEHTVVDDQGNIVKDAMILISNIELDEIDITDIVQSKSVYIHDFNGTSSQTQDKFFGSLGCNGCVTLKLSAPIYHWLLENM